jgi:CheY-like chemotaxis protein
VAFAGGPAGVAESGDAVPSSAELSVNVLLVSATARINSQVRSALVGRSDIELLEVTTPQRALQQLDDVGGFDVVVADNDLHPTGGLFLAREIKARGQMGRDMPPIILILAREQDVWLSNWSQADAYVLKPIDPFDFAEVFDAVVAGEELPALPRVGGDPTPSLLDVPGGEAEAEGLESGSGSAGVAGAVGGATGP